MIHNAAQFDFKAQESISRARRVLIKPSAHFSEGYPVTTSRDILARIIKGIRWISDADIILLDGTPDGAPIQPIYQSLGYDFPRVLTLDVKDSTWVEVDNPLAKPFIIPTFWVPNIILSSDYLISVAPLNVVKGQGHMTIANLMSLLPMVKYGGSNDGWKNLHALGLDKVLADLYFTLPFDMGIVEARQKFVSDGDPVHGTVEDVGKVFIGKPFEVDLEVTETLGIKADYMENIKLGREEVEF
ncbi:MAG: DUF362 domain-containing protein [Dehalococcoidia bacterium]|nr:MAG: DUF362 domain-containing protein [Dehalococcoidia bacterium]